MYIFVYDSYILKLQVYKITRQSITYNITHVEVERPYSNKVMFTKYINYKIKMFNKIQQKYEKTNLCNQIMPFCKYCSVSIQLFGLKRDIKLFYIIYLWLKHCNRYLYDYYKLSIEYFEQRCHFQLSVVSINWVRTLASLTRTV